MKTIKILETFDGYPNGTRVTFTEGDEVEVAATYANLLIEKGHAREVGRTTTKAAAPKEEPAPTKKAAEK
jgi:hypothetical protein